MGHIDAALGFKADMILGTPFLSMFQTTIDYSKKLIELNFRGVDTP